MDRTFYKNVIFGPKLWVDKGDPLRSWTFPEIRDTIAIKDWSSVQVQANTLGTILQNTARYFLENKNLHGINTNEF